MAIKINLSVFLIRSFPLLVCFFLCAHLLLTALLWRLLNHWVLSNHQIFQQLQLKLRVTVCFACWPAFSKMLAELFFILSTKWKQLHFFTSSPYLFIMILRSLILKREMLILCTDVSYKSELSDNANQKLNDCWAIVTQNYIWMALDIPLWSERRSRVGFFTLPSEE